jgi:hypothetical protein
LRLPNPPDPNGYKAQAFLRQHRDHGAIANVCRNRPLSAADIAELERMLIESVCGACAFMVFVPTCRVR